MYCRAGIGSLRRAGSTSSPVKYVNTRLRELWVGAVDCEGNTALHVAAMLVERSEKGGNEEAARLACWLLENGLNVNTQNVHGETALHICMKAARGQRGRMLIRCLAMKGADAQNIIDEDGNNVVAVLLANRSLEQEMKNHYLQLLESARRGSPSSSFQDIHLQASSSSGKACGGGSTGDNSLMKVQKLKGYSYLSFFIGRLLILDARAAAWDRPRLSFSVYNSKGQVLEEMCTLRHPIVSSVDKLQWPDENGPTSPSSSSDRRGSNSTLQRRGSESSTPKRNLDYLDLWWGTSWHMRTPLENIEEGSFVLIQLQQELSDSTSGSSKGGAAVDAYANDEPVYWTRFVIDVDTIQTSEEDLLPLNFMESCASLLNVPAASRISQRAPPLFLTAAVLPPVQPTSVGATSGGGNRSQQYVTATMSHLTVDCVLHQLDRKVDISSVMKA